MAKLRIKRFKHWYQVVRDGYTVAQFLHRTQAEEFIKDNRGGSARASTSDGRRYHGDVTTERYDGSIYTHSTMAQDNTSNRKLGKITLQDIEQTDTAILNAARDVCSVELARRVAGGDRNMRVQLNPAATIGQIAEWKAKAEAYDSIMRNRDDD